MSTKYEWKNAYEALNAKECKDAERPLIGITGNYTDQSCTLAEGYYRSILEAGGMPVIIPPYEDETLLIEQLDRLDGLLFSGGGDINPLLLGEQPIPQLHSITPMRDKQELLLARLAYDRQIPMLGICKGIQVIAAALGGTLYQDIYCQKEGVTVKHSQDLDRTEASHTIDIATNTLLYNIFNKETIAVNSFHHQAVRDVPQGFKASALSSDGIIEAIESTEHKSIIGVQWHPECFCLKGDDCMKPLFAWFVGEASSFMQAKKIHSDVISLDSHCDTPMFFDQKINFQSRDPRILVDLHKMHEGHLDASIMVAYLPQGVRDRQSLNAATEKAMTILDGIETMAAQSPEAIRIAYTPDDIILNKREGRKSIMMGIENGYAIGRDISNIERFRKRGVVYMTLCHNGDNDICDSARGQNEHGGVSKFGAEVINEMNRVGMMVDLSHASEKSFSDAIDISSRPIVCSHSSARALCDHPRNLTDQQLRRLAETGGVAQVTLYKGFLRTDGQANILDAIAHLNHMIDVAGVEHIGIGTDFDGDGGIPGLASASELINFTRQMLAHRYNKQDIELIWGGNFLRLMRQYQQK